MTGDQKKKINSRWSSRLINAKHVGKRSVYLFTIEREPNTDLKNRLMKWVTVNLPNGTLCCAADEVSDDGYHHSHLVIKTKCARVFLPMVQALQREFKWAKENESEISVSAWAVPAESSDTYKTLIKYITHPHYHKKYDTEYLIIEERKPTCTFWKTLGEKYKLDEEHDLTNIFDAWHYDHPHECDLEKNRRWAHRFNWAQLQREKFAFCLESRNT